MIELALLASASGIIGMLIRAALENESSKFCLYHGIAIGAAAGIFAYLNPGLSPLITARQYFAMSMFFAVFGYSTSDILDSIAYVIRNPYNPMKMFAAVWNSIKREMKGK